MRQLMEITAGGAGLAPAKHSSKKKMAEKKVTNLAKEAAFKVETEGLAKAVMQIIQTDSVRTLTRT